MITLSINDCAPALRIHFTILFTISVLFLPRKVCCRTATVLHRQHAMLTTSPNFTFFSWAAFNLRLFRAGDKQCHTHDGNANTCNQISSAPKARVLMWNLLSLAWTATVDTFLASTSASTLLSESASEKVQSHVFLLKILLGLLLAWFFLEGQAPF